MQKRIQSLDHISCTAKIWMTRTNNNHKARSTLYLNTKLAAKYGMNKPCRVAFVDRKDGILIRYLHPIG